MQQHGQAHTFNHSYLKVKNVKALAVSENGFEELQVKCTNHAVWPKIWYWFLSNWGRQPRLCIHDQHHSRFHWNHQNCPCQDQRHKKGYLNSTQVAAVRWRIQDYQDRNHRFDISGTNLVPDFPIWLLSPQLLAKEMTKVDQESDRTACHTYSDRGILTWHHDKYCRTIPLGKINVPVILSAPAYKNFENHVKCNTTFGILDIPRA